MRKVIFMFLILALVLPAYAQSNSMKGLTTAKFVVDLNQGNGNMLKLRLQLILETVDDIVGEGVIPDVVVAVRGGASDFMAVTDDYIDPKDIRVKASIAKLIDKLADRGVRLEQCAVALRMLGISPKEINPKLHVVQNGYVSLIGYQNKGYAYMPME